MGISGGKGLVHTKCPQMHQKYAKNYILCETY